MRGFAVLLLVLWAGLLAYTALVVAAEGLGLLPIFFGAIAEMGWPGQFNLDFALFLLLAGFWTAWRGGFAPRDLLLSLLAMTGGAGFLLPYLALLCRRPPDDPAAVLLGVHKRSAGQ